MAHRILFTPGFRRAFRSLSADVQGRISKAINALSEDPRPSGAIKLAGNEDLYRIRVGTYRVVYMVEDDRLLVLIVDVGHRKEIYKGAAKQIARQALLAVIEADPNEK